MNGAEKEETGMYPGTSLHIWVGVGGCLQERRCWAEDGGKLAC